MIVTIFRNRLKPEVDQEYGHWVTRMSELAVTMPGYISHKGFAAQDGERVTIIEFESEEAMREWSRHAEHAEAKKKGRMDFYVEYRVQICTQLRESVFPSRPSNGQ